MARRLSPQDIKRIIELVVEDLHNSEWRDATIHRGQSYLASLCADPAKFDIEMLALIQSVNRSEQLTGQKEFRPEDIEIIYNEVKQRSEAER